MSPEERENRRLTDEALERHATFRSEEGWKRKTYRDPVVLESISPENSRMIVSLADQRALLLQGDRVAIDFHIASGKRSHPTPTGSYTILQKSEKYQSNLYGKIVDEEGEVVVSDADTRVHEVPEGGVFRGSPMPYWLRLTNSGVGLHVGHLPGRPASHGCVRMPRAVAPQVFRLVKLGTPVDIVDNYQPPLPVDP